MAGFRWWTRDHTNLRRKVHWYERRHPPIYTPLSWLLLHLTTEVSGYHQQLPQSCVATISGNQKPSNLHIFCWRNQSIEKTLDFICKISQDNLSLKWSNSGFYFLILFYSMLFIVNVISAFFAFFLACLCDEGSLHSVGILKVLISNKQMFVFFEDSEPHHLLLTFCLQRLFLTSRRQFRLFNVTKQTHMRWLKTS